MPNDDYERVFKNDVDADGFPICPRCNRSILPSDAVKWEQVGTKHILHLRCGSSAVTCERQ